MYPMLSNAELVENLKLLGLVGLDTNKPISYTGFKNRASIHKYGKQYKIVFVGHPRQNLFGFYTMYGNDSEVMKQAYEMFVDLVKGRMLDFEVGNIQWGNAGIPIGYGRLRRVQ